MLFLRNPEIKKFVTGYGMFMAAAAALAMFQSLGAAIYVLGICAAALILFLLFTEKRYRDISEMSYQLDRILHGKESIHFAPCREGELALLQTQIHKMLIRYQEQAERLEREKSYLGDSIADISHQIRTPLTSICMIVPRLGREELSDGEREGYVLEIGRLLTRMEWQIAALLKMARLESGTALFRQCQVRVKSVVEKALEPLEIFMEVKGILWKTEISENIFFSGDAGWMAEALGNIIKNCAEHMEMGGTVTIEASENPLYTEILIADDGQGFTKEDLPHLFERFYKGKNSGVENAGIGLALAQMIVQKQKGIIRAENRTTGGAVFTIRFYKGAI